MFIGIETLIIILLIVFGIGFTLGVMLVRPRYTR